MSSISGSSVIVFGSTGQLGTELQRTARENNLKLHALSRQEADIADEAMVRAAIGQSKPALAVNAAAYTKVDDSEEQREAAERGNVLGPQILARVCEAAGIPLVHISTDYVFDGTKTDAYVETDPVQPVSYYGLTKARGEDAVREACPHHAILRVSWLYSEFGQNFLKTMLRLAGERDLVRVVADQYGSPTSTRDVASAILRIAPQLISDRQKSGTYHFTGDGVTTWYGFARAAIARYCALSGRNVSVEPISTAEFPTKTRRPANSALDCSKFERVFGFRGAPWQKEVEEIAGILTAQQRASRASEGKANAGS